MSEIGHPQGRPAQPSDTILLQWSVIWPLLASGLQLYEAAHRLHLLPPFITDSSHVESMQITAGGSYRFPASTNTVQVVNTCKH